MAFTTSVTEFGHTFANAVVVVNEANLKTQQETSKMIL